ncbi:MAG: M28 family metallopeptidase [Acidimicrobiia bacterium]|nr:M28 family metallopeptidase [Acidimicrobiia bacterium]
MREHLLERAADAGLGARHQQGDGGAQNVIVELPGTGSTGTVLITAHYDSVPDGPGAGDAGVAVVALLESMRAVAAGPPLRNDVVFLFTDGEEAGWLGAKAFAASGDAEEVAVVIAIESEPGDGPTTLQQTSRGDGWLVEQLAATDPPAWVSSVSNSAERDDFDSDFDVLSRAGLAGIEFANPKDGTRYHLPGDTRDAIDLDHLQAHGNTVTSLVRRFGDVDLQRERDENDRVFTTLPAVGIVSLASNAATALAVAALVAVVLLVAYQTRRSPIGGRGVLWGVVATGVAIASIVITATIIWELLVRVQGGGDTKDFPDFDGSDTALTALYAGIGAAFVWAVARYAARRDPVEAALGGLVWLSALHVVLMIESPLAVSLTTWPLLAGVGAILAWTAVRPRPALPLLVVAAGPSMLFFVPQLTLWVQSPSEPMPLMALAGALLFASLVPQLAVILGCIPTLQPRQADHSDR